MNHIECVECGARDVQDLRDHTPYWKHVRAAMASPPIIATFVGLGVGLVQPVSNALFESVGVGRAFGGSFETLAQPGVACSTLVMAAALMPDITGSAPSDRKCPRKYCCSYHPQKGGRRRCPAGPVGPGTVGMLCLLRLVLIPAMGFSLFYALRQGGLLYPTELDANNPHVGSRSQLVSLVILLEFAAPSAQTAVVVLSKLGMHESARKLAFAYIFQYSLSVFTLSSFTALALHMITL